MAVDCPFLGVNGKAPKVKIASLLFACPQPLIQLLAATIQSANGQGWAGRRAGPYLMEVQSGAFVFKLSAVCFALPAPCSASFGACPEIVLRGSSEATFVQVDYHIQFVTIHLLRPPGLRLRPTRH